MHLLKEELIKKERVEVKGIHHSKLNKEQRAEVIEQVSLKEYISVKASLYHRKWMTNRTRNILIAIGVITSSIFIVAYWEAFILPVIGLIMTVAGIIVAGWAIGAFLSDGGWGNYDDYCD